VIPWQLLQVTLQAMFEANESDDSAKTRSLLLSTIDGFTPQCDLTDWLQIETASSEQKKDRIKG